jgi:hypothetical protein
MVTVRSLDLRIELHGSSAWCLDSQPQLRGLFDVLRLIVRQQSAI